MHNYPSQLGQEKWVLDFLNFKRNGIFIEIGAGNGIELSNTYVLERQYGWTGICIEPSRQFEFLKKNRKAICSDSVIWNTDNQEVLFLEDYKNGPDNWFSGIKSQIDCHQVGGIEYLKKTKTLESLLSENNIERHIHYLSIDTEGSEFEIIRNFPFAEWKIDLVSIEHNFVEPKRKMIYELLSSFGYIKQEIIDTQFDDWYYHERLLKKTQFLIRRQEELYRKTFEIKNKDLMSIENFKSNFEEILLAKNQEISSLMQNNSNQLIEIESQKKEIINIKKSLSWRMTKPLRILGSYIFSDRI